MCTRFDSEVNSHTSTRKLVTTLIITVRLYNLPLPGLWFSHQSVVLLQTVT